MLISSFLVREQVSIWIAGGQDAAERKRQLFDHRLIELALARLRTLRRLGNANEYGRWPSLALPTPLKEATYTSKIAT